MTTYNTHTFDNGLRLIHLPSASPVVYCGYQIKAGTRDEEPGEEGLAHFCEHATFKGTARRNSLQIINALESVGGELNAYTNKEGTTYYAAVLKEHFPRAVDVLSDIVFCSAYPDAELEKEKEVVVEEIESYNDSPAELIYDDFENMLFAGHPLGHNILGTAENVRRFSADDVRRFAHKHYRPENAVFFVYGDVTFREVKASLKRREDSFRSSEQHPERIENNTTRHEIPKKTTTLIEKPEETTTLIEIPKGTHQAHVMIGSLAYSVNHALRIPLFLLNNMLGGPGMNARLNVALRERHGLVYTVESVMAAYSDTGSWSVYFGCDHSDVKRCLRLVRHELDKLMKKPISSTLLLRAKQQLKGQLGVASDNRENFALDFGKAFLHYQEERDIERLYEEIDKVTAEQLLTIANELFAPERMLTLIYR